MDHFRRFAGKCAVPRARGPTGAEPPAVAGARTGRRSGPSEGDRRAGWVPAIRGEEGDFSTAWWQEGSLAADVAVLVARVPVERRHPRAQPAWGAPGAQGHRGPPLGVRWTATMVLGRTPNVSRGRDFSEKILHILLGGARRHRGQLWIHLVRRLRAANRWSRPGLVGRGVRRHGPSSCRRTCRSGRTPAPQGQCSTGAGVFDLVPVSAKATSTPRSPRFRSAGRRRPHRRCGVRGTHRIPLVANFRRFNPGNPAGRRTLRAARRAARTSASAPVAGAALRDPTGGPPGRLGKHRTLGRWWRSAR